MKVPIGFIAKLWSFISFLPFFFLLLLLGIIKDMSSLRGPKKQKRPSSRAPIVPPADPQFRDEDSAVALAAFSRIRLNVSRSISVTNDYRFGLYALFIGTGLESLLDRSFQFSSAFVYLWCANLRPSRTPVARSFSADLAQYVEIPNDGESLWPLFKTDLTFSWREVNHVLTGLPGHGMHNPEVKFFCWDAYVIQHILRNNLFPKTGDKIHITPMLSLATYFYMRRIGFNVAEAFLEMMRGISYLRTQRRLQNISLGHLIQHVVLQKYSVPLGQGMTNYWEVVPFRPRDLAQVLRRFGAGGEHVAEEGDFAEEADAAGVGEEEREAMGRVPLPPHRGTVGEQLAQIETGMECLYTSGEARDAVLARMLAVQERQGGMIDVMEKHVDEFCSSWDAWGFGGGDGGAGGAGISADF